MRTVSAGAKRCQPEEDGWTIGRAAGTVRYGKHGDPERAHSEHPVMLL